MSETVRVAERIANIFGTVLFQNCVDVTEALRKGDFGSCDAQLEEYIKKCHARFPYAAAFRPVSSTTSPSESNHVSQDQDNCNSNWWPLEAATTKLQGINRCLKCASADFVRIRLKCFKWNCHIIGCWFFVVCRTSGLLTNKLFYYVLFTFCFFFVYFFAWICCELFHTEIDFTAILCLFVFLILFFDIFLLHPCGTTYLIRISMTALVIRLFRNHLYRWVFYLCVSIVKLRIMNGPESPNDRSFSPPDDVSQSKVC
jgi:hypothetical protein